jgi:hypothetical protein
MAEPKTRRLLGRRRADGVDLDGLERRLVWIMGSPRTGSTWLLSLLGRHPGLVPIDEPLIGAHLNPSSEVVARAPEEKPFTGIHTSQRARTDYFFADEFAPVWRPILRELILARVQAHIDWMRVAKRHRKTVEDPIVLIKEPNGSHGAQELFDVLPNARLIVLLRDPRDVLDSMLDAAAAADWRAETPRTAADLNTEQRRRVLHDAANTWLAMTDAVLRTQERMSDEQSIVVRYEDMRRDAETELQRIVAWMGLAMSKADIADRVGRLDFDRLPAAQKGPGRFNRAATPGLWRKSLTADEQRAVEGWLGPRLAELGYSTDT